MDWINSITMVLLLPLAVFSVCAVLIVGKNNIVNTDAAIAASVRLKMRDITFLFAAAFITIFICSKSSPLYPFNDWGDTNCYFTVGRAMLHGMVPYRDLFEQKGPLLHMMYAAAAFISETSFIGVYFLEVIACFAFLFFGYKTMQLVYPSCGILLVPVLCVAVYAERSFSSGGSAEELCLPFLAFALYAGLKSIKEKRMPSDAACFWIGVTSACVLWIKYSMLGFYFGWIIVPAVLLLKSRGWKKLIRMFLFIAIGAIVLTLPILAYFVMNNALADLWEVYFYDNIFYYAAGSDIMSHSLPYTIFFGLLYTAITNTLSVFAIADFMVFMKLKDRKTEFWFFATTLIGMFLFTYMNGHCYVYYSIVFSAFAPAGLCVAAKSLSDLHKEKTGKKIFCRKHIGVYTCVLCAILSFLLCGNTYYLQYDKSDLPQYQFAEIISEYSDDATLLNFCFLDGGFYMAAGILPSTEYFYYPNLILPELHETQMGLVANGCVDFVVTENLMLDSDLYEHVAEASIQYEGGEVVYHLYHLIG